MRLELGIIKINEVQFGNETVVKDGTLYIDKDELIALTTQDDRLSQANVELAKKALHRASTKLPCSCTIEISQNK